MNSFKFFSIVAIFSIIPVAFAAGTHSSGHDDGDHQSMMKDMGHWMAPVAEAKRKNPVKLSSESILAGAKLYQNNCVSCHGADGKGDGIASTGLDPKPANLRAMAGTHPDGDFAYKIKTGRGTMPAWGSTLSDTEVWHLVNYIQLLSKEPVASTSEEIDHKHAAGEGHGS